MVAGGDQDWRGKLSLHLNKTENNLNSIRKDAQQRPTAQSTENRGSGNAFVSRTISSNTRPIGAGTYGNATTELSSLLAAVQGSLSDLRMEVATAKQLSHHAGAAVVGNVIPSQQRTASSRPVSAPRAAAVASGAFTVPQQLPTQPRQQLIQRNNHPPQIRAPREAFPDFRNVHAAVSSNGYLTGNMLSPPSLSQFSQYDQNFDSPQRHSRSILEVEASINNSVHQVSRVLETKMTDFEKRLDRQINRAVAAPPAVTEAAVAEYSATTTDPGQFIAAPSNVAMALSSPPSTVRPQGHPASESLVLLTMGKADAAERAVTDLRAELEAVRQQHAEALSQMQQQVLTLLDADKRSKDVLSKMAVRMEAFMLQQKDETDALSRALERSEADQRTAVGRCGRDLETVRAESASRCDVMSGRLDAVGVRLGAAEGVSVKVDAVMAQLEGALRRLQKLEEAPASAVSSADSAVLPAVSALQVRDLRLHSSRSLEDDLHERKLKDLDQHLVALQAEMSVVKSDVKMNQEYMSMKMERLAMSVESHRSMDAAALIARTTILEEWMISVKRGMSINSTGRKNFSFARPSLESLSGTTAAAAGAAVVLAGASTEAAAARTSAPSGGNNTREVIASEVAKGEEDGDCSVASLVATGMSQTSVHTFGKGIDFEAHLAAMITETQDELTKIRELTITALQKRMTRMESYLKDKESWLDEKARDARFEVTEEFARDAYRGLDELKDEVEKRVENLTSQIQELKEERKKHDPAALDQAISAVTGVALGAAAAAVAASGTAYASAAAGGTTASSAGDFLEGASSSAGDLLKVGEATEEAFTRSAPVQMSNEIAEKALQGLEELREEVELSMDSLREAIQNLQDGPGGAAGHTVLAMSEAVEKLKMEVEQLGTAMAAQQEQLLLVQAEGGLEGQAELLLQTREEQERMTALVEEQGQQIGGLQVRMTDIVEEQGQQIGGLQVRMTAIVEEQGQQIGGMQVRMTAIVEEQGQQIVGMQVRMTDIVEEQGQQIGGLQVRMTAIVEEQGQLIGGLQVRMTALVEEQGQQIGGMQVRFHSRWLCDMMYHSSLKETLLSSTHSQVTTHSLSMQELYYAPVLLFDLPGQEASLPGHLDFFTFSMCLLIRPFIPDTTRCCVQAQLSELAHSHHEFAEGFDKDLDKMRSSLSTASAKMQEVSLLHSSPPAEPAAAVELRLDIAELRRRQGILDSCSEVMALRVGAVEQRVECMMAYRLDTSAAAAQKLAAHEHESERLLKLLGSCQDVHSLRLQALDAAVSENGHRVTAVERKAEGASAAAEEAVGALSLLEMQLLGMSSSVEGGEEGLIPQLRSEVHRLSIVQAAAQSRGGSEGGGESSRRTKAGPTVAPAIASAAGFGAAVAVSEASKSASYAPSTYFPPENTAMQSAEWSNAHDALEGHTSVSAAGRLSQTMTTYENPLAGWDSPSQAALDAEQGMEESSTYAAVASQQRLKSSFAPEDASQQRLKSSFAPEDASQQRLKSSFAPEDASQQRLKSSFAPEDASQQRLKSSFAPEDAALAVDSRALLSVGEDDVAHLRKALYYQDLSGTAPAGQTLSSQHHDVQGSHGHPSSAIVGAARPSLFSNTPPPLSNPTTKSIMPAADPSLLTSSWKEEDEDISTLRMADQPSSSVRGVSDEAQALTEVTLARGVGACGTTHGSPSRLSGRLPPLGVVVVQEGGDAEGGQLVLSPGSSRQLVLSPGSSRLRVMSPASQLTPLASSPSALTRDVVVGSPRLKALEPLGKVASPRADLCDDRSSQEWPAPSAATIAPLAVGAAAGAALYLAEGTQGAADVHSPNRHNLPPLVSTAAPLLLPPTDALRTFLPLDAPPGMTVTSSSPRSVPGNPYAEEEEATAAHRVITDSDSFDEIPEEEEMYEEEDVEGESAELEASTTTSAPAPAPTYTTTSATPPENVFTGETVFVDRATKTSVISPVIPTPARTLPQASSGQLPSLVHVTDDSPPLFSVQAELLAQHVPQLQGHQQLSESVAEEYPAEPRMERMDSINNSGLFDESSLSGLDFGEISGEAERFSEMLATPAPAKQTLDFRATEASPANSPGSQEECNADAMASGSVVLQVQGTLDFASSDDGEEEDSSDEESNMHMQLKMKRGQQQAVHMVVHDDDSSSGELEIFRPPPPSSSRAEQRDSPAGTILSLEAVSGLGSSREEAALGTYRLVITTGSRPGAGTEQDVHLTLIGLSGSSQHLINRDAGEFTGFRFCRGQVDEVLVDAGAELGDITGIQVATGLSWEFGIKDWVRGGQNGGKTYRYGARTPSGSLSRESSFNRGSAASGLILGDAESASRGSAAEAAAAAVKLSQQQGGAGLRGRLTGARAFADESFDVDSEPDSPAAVNSSLSGYAIQKAPAVAQSLRGAMGVVLDEDIEDVDEALRIGPLGNQAPAWQQQQQQQQGLLPDRRSSAGVSASSGGSSDYLSSTGRRAPGLAPSTQGRRSTMFGEPEGFTATPAEPAAHASTTSSGGFTGRPPLPRTPSGTSQRSGSLERLSSSGLPPLGVESMARRSGSGSGGGGAGLSGELSRTGSGSLISSFGDSHEDLPGLSGGGGAAGGGPSRNGGRLVPIHDPEDEDLEVTPGSAGRGGSGGGPGGSYSRVYGGLMEAEASRTSLDSWDGQSVDGSEASLSLFAPGGIRPPTAGTRVGHLGTSKRRVSFADFAEELLYTPHDYSSDDGSVKSWTEEELLEGQGLNSTTNRSPQQVETARVAAAVTDQPPFKRKGPPASEDVFEDVPITGQEVQRRGTTLVQGSHRVSGPNRRTATTTFKLKVFTADKLNSGLGSTMVNIEMLGSKLTVSQALPREGGDTFLRGSVERFSVDLDPGQEFGEVLAIKVWHEAPSGGFRSLFGDGRWCLERIELEHKLTGTRYVFLNSDRDGWIKAGRKNCVVLKPIKERMDESEDLKLVQEELQAQLLENSSLSTQDRQTLQEKLSKIDSRLLKLRM
ncbi:hypothetical protein CEUSTIGMA_g1116.t1 [Chlamydomonas eustigma]|uniref:PLAT domain-containing protein n=1 Tax=Chlamydomonas eustigma TaxID=1157962 RepID=A0A250WS37_9CHLO|nr:hypothetical protein CEUSTIGMA_g1116.t1 [Chlamydomonas eustigma]|eukprot:GAX73665.1 hypothetical protein CEUSTIGMA_g1116.t1 [Chlamydomonas eustigma]